MFVHRLGDVRSPTRVSSFADSGKSVHRRGDVRSPTGGCPFTDSGKSVRRLGDVRSLTRGSRSDCLPRSPGKRAVGTCPMPRRRRGESREGWRKGRENRVDAALPLPACKYAILRARILRIIITSPTSACRIPDFRLPHPRPQPAAPPAAACRISCLRRLQAAVDEASQAAGRTAVRGGRRAREGK